jgi:hypothetical protein
MCAAVTTAAAAGISAAGMNFQSEQLGCLQQQHINTCMISSATVSLPQVPIALVSLVDENVQWFKSTQGLPGVDRTPRPTSFCAW